MRFGGIEVSVFSIKHNRRKMVSVATQRVLALLFLWVGGCGRPVQSETVMETPTTDDSGMELGDKPIGENFDGRRLQFDFGLVSTDTVLKHEFEIPDDTKVGWRLIGIETSCRCTEAIPDSKTVPPGGALKVLVTYRSPQGTTDDRQRVTLHFESATTIVLTLSAGVREYMVLSPENWSPGLSSGESSEVIGSIENHSGTNWQGVAMSVSDDART